MMLPPVAFAAFPIRVFSPEKPSTPSTGLINYLYESGLGVYGCGPPTRHNPAQNAGWF